MTQTSNSQKNLRESRVEPRNIFSIFTAVSHCLAMFRCLIFLQGRLMELTADGFMQFKARKDY